MTEQNQNPESEEPTGSETGADGSAQQDAGASAPASGASEDAATESAESISDEELAVLSGQVSADEVLADLQRVNAEYANYRRRTEAGREVERERTTGAVLTALLPILDDLDRAEKHGDLGEDTGFGQVGAKLRTTVTKMGLAAIGAVGENFDPQIHDAIFQQPSADVTVATVADVVETGYQLGSTQLRPAKVVVSIPAE